MSLASAANRICRDIIAEVGERSGRTFLQTNTYYADGDRIVLYLDVDGQHLRISDRGNTMFKLAVASAAISEHRRELLDNILAQHSIELENRWLKKLTDERKLGTDVLSMCQAIAQISNFLFVARPREVSYLTHQLEALFVDRVAPYRHVHRKWCLRAADPNRVYPVDFRFNGRHPARHVFAITSSEKSVLVAAVCEFLKANSASTPSIAIFDKDIRLTDRHVDRVRTSVDEVVFGLSQHEQQVVDFALAK